MPTPPNSPAAKKRHTARTAPPAKQPLDSNRKESTVPHEKTTTSFNKEGKPVNYVPETPAAFSPEVDKPVEEPVVEKKNFFGNLFKR